MAIVSRTRDLFHRRKKTFFGFWVGTILLTVIGSQIVVPMYEASSTILVKADEQGANHMLGAELSAVTHGNRGLDDVDVTRVLATSKPYVDEMVSALQLRDSKGDLIAANGLTDVGIMSTIARKLSAKPGLYVVPHKETGMLEILTESSDPDEAMMMSNALAEIMIRENQNLVRARYRNARTFLESEIAKVREGYDAGLKQISDFKKKEKTLDVGLETKLAVEKLERLLTKKEESLLSLNRTKATRSQLKEQLAAQSPEFLSASMLKDNPQVQVLKKRITELRLQLTEAGAELTDEHPHVVALREKIATAQSELEREVDVYQSTAPELAELERRIAMLEAQLQGVNREITAHVESLEDLSDKNLEQARFDMEINAAPRQYSSLTDVLHKIGVAEVTTLSGIRVIEPATRPLSPSFPQHGTSTAWGILLGLIIGCGAACVKERMDDTIRSIQDVRLPVPISFLGTVPKSDTLQVPLISSRDPNDPFCESYRKIRTHLELLGYERREPLRSLLMTAAVPNEGNTLTAANLAISAAREGKKVVIIDADLRRPSLHRYFDLPNEKGITDVLQNRIEINHAVQSTSVHGLRVIPSGPPYQDAGALIGSDQMARLLSALRTNYDLTIVDAAPFFLKADSLVLARYVDGTVIVLKSKKTTRHAMGKLMETLGNSWIQPIGFIVNEYPSKNKNNAYPYDYRYSSARKMLSYERN